MTNKLQSRRSFLRASGAAVGLSLAGVHLSSLLPLGKAAAKARDSGTAMQVLSAEEAADIEAITAHIIPTDDTPGAREAGVVYFIDAAMGAQLAHMLAPLRSQLAEINALTGEAASRFSSLETSRQYSVMQAADKAGALGLFVTLTMFGMFSMPAYGGNRDHAGWDLIGFDHRHAWFPPFGHYDAQQGADQEKDGSQ